MSAQHTPLRAKAPTPSGIPTYTIVDAQGRYYASVIIHAHNSGATDRIVQCVNACAGVPSEVLQAGQAGGLPWSVADQLDQRQLVGELVEACEALIRYDDDSAKDGIAFMQLYAEAVSKARAARAKATGSAA